MTTANNIKVEGATTFSASVASSFRYAIEIKDEKLSVWMEDCSSKKQWYTGEKEKATYITAINSIMAASSTDYVELFRDALDSDLNSSGQMQRKLTTLNGGSIRLELALPVRALRSVWLAEYKFDLEPVSVERIDILESKLRDQEEKLEKLQIHGTSGQNAAFVQLVASKKDDKSRLRWNKFESDDFSVNGNDGVVKVLQPGIYTIGGIVTSAPEKGCSVQLTKNGISLQVACSGFTKGSPWSTPLYSVTRLEKNDKLMVTCSSKPSSISYLSVVRLSD
ncbi:hypothetical protein PR001_g19101 [Phytophthora rubi]|uniref:Uncharacterized protein n=1 Tax=Phytophthora rubi TaxID=129364 RepID=A0A6A3K0Y4_9STRA|nr:hypothetical protein PR002_g19597 [Phytophthora rubi]KAE8999287.1 hypothetical protein PR001_g19101 [Phytophthora rubi]